MAEYILAIDNGTTGTTAALIDTSDYSLVDKINQEFPQIFPKPGWVEHNLEDIWSTVEFTTKTVLEKNSIKGEQIKCIGITNQRETTCAFNSNGLPLHNAIVWQDRRTENFCNQLKDKNLSDKFAKKTGLPIDSYFSGTKMNWLLANSEKVKEAAASDDLKFGTIDTFLLYKLSDGQSFCTEPSNASRTLLMELNSTTWDSELCEILGISNKYLPEIKDSFSEFGFTKALSFLPDGIPITGILGDQQSALFGQAGFNEGDMKCTYGTGSFLLLNTGNKIKYSNNGLLTTVAYRKDGETIYALEGSVYIAGAAVQFLRDNLKIIKTSPEVESLAKEVTDPTELEHLFFLPFFTGLGSPYWVSDAKAALIGMTRDTSAKHIARACLEGVCFSINDVINAFEQDFDNPITSLKVDGGAVVNNFFMQMQSDISNSEIIRPKVIETTAYGAGLAAAIGIKLLKFDELGKFWKKENSFKPNVTQREYYTAKILKWKNYIKRLYL